MEEIQVAALAQSWPWRAGGWPAFDAESPLVTQVTSGKWARG